ncbi:MAG: DUF2975 domain-containing protein [Defluviitaleaceae bacterium]|nr:DUF2975 domain-containing protein [Defluviitaleaceae bacterium]MCL2263501.1 DUF2975 domain-containing protein [Defluviitaleaceae bacterium]MCL2263931.1 DUF2975 domain-containing protein [Defluviitaleaceae bacterium]
MFCRNIIDLFDYPVMPNLRGNFPQDKERKPPRTFRYARSFATQDCGKLTAKAALRGSRTGLKKRTTEGVFKMKEPVVSRILKYALYAAFVVGLVGAVTLPFTIDTLFRVFRNAPILLAEYRAFVLPFLMAIAVPCLWVVMEMIFMLNSIPKEPFVIRNVKALYRIGVIFFVLSLAFFGWNFMFLNIVILAGAFFMIGSGLFAFTLAALIKQAIVFREENELTI